MSKKNGAIHVIIGFALIIAFIVFSTMYTRSQYELCMATGGVEYVGINNVSCSGGAKGMNSYK